MTTPEPGSSLRNGRVAAIVLAAGKGARFAAAAPGAGPKLLTDIEGVPMLEATVRSLRAGGVTDVVVVVAAGAPARLNEAANAMADRVAINEAPDRGMLSSIQAGLAALGNGVAVCLVMPADMPFALPASVARVIEAAASGRTVSPRYRSRGGHPVALSTTLRDHVARADASASLKPLLYADDPWLLDVDDPGILRDVDVPADLAE